MKSLILLLTTLLSVNSYAQNTCELHCLDLAYEFIPDALTGFRVDLVTKAETVIGRGRTSSEALQNTVQICKDKGYQEVFGLYTLADFYYQADPKSKKLTWDNILNSTLPPSEEHNCTR